MAEEEETPQATAGAAVKEPPAETPIIETPEAVPPVEQEQVPEGEKPKETDSGADQVEEEADLTPEARRTAFLERVAAVYEADPELAKMAEERRPKPDEDAGEARIDWELERSQKERDDEWVQVNQAIAPYVAPPGGPSQAQNAIQGIIDMFNESYLDSAKKLHDGSITDPAQLQFDTQAWTNQIMPFISGGASASYTAGSTSERLKTIGALEKLPSYRLMNADERKAYQEAVRGRNLAEAVTVVVTAASRSAPEGVSKEAQKKAEKKANVLKLTKDVFEGLGMNGKKPAGGSPKTKEYKDMTADERAALTPEEIDADTKRWLAHQE